MKNRKILVFDNYDSFTYNIVHYLQNLTNETIDVFRNDKISLNEIDQYDKIVLSPGPGLPNEAGLLIPLIKRFCKTKSILGVCLGHQAIGEVFGGKLINLDKVYHGVATPIQVLDTNEKLFKGLPSEFTGGRYHSWVVDNVNLPECFNVTAVDQQGMIMAITHKEYDLRGVQFHPESVLTEHGMKIMKNWLNI